MQQLNCMLAVIFSNHKNPIKYGKLFRNFTALKNWPESHNNRLTSWYGDTVINSRYLKLQSSELQYNTNCMQIQNLLLNVTAVTNTTNN